MGHLIEYVLEFMRYLEEKTFHDMHRAMFVWDQKRPDIFTKNTPELHVATILPSERFTNEVVTPWFMEWAKRYKIYLHEYPVGNSPIWMGSGEEVAKIFRIPLLMAEWDVLTCIYVPHGEYTRYQLQYFRDRSGRLR